MNRAKINNQLISTDESFGLRQDQKESFENQNCRFCRLEGPNTLVRMTGLDAKGNRSSPYGQFWFDYADLENFESDIFNAKKRIASFEKELRGEIRQSFAVCIDWSSLESYYLMYIPKNESILVSHGLTRAQPIKSYLNININLLYKDPKKFERTHNNVLQKILIGGYGQFVVAKESINKARNQSWVHGPNSLKLPTFH